MSEDIWLTDSEKQRRFWMAALAKCCAPADAVKVVDSLVAMLALMNDLPDAAFTEDSLRYVTERAKRAPSYADLRKWLDDWWAANKPRPPALPAPDDHWRAKWLAHLDQCRDDWSRPENVRASVDSLRGHPMENQMGKLLGMAVAKFGYGNLGLVPPEWHPHE